MIIFPNCKINLGLRITAKRNDGFHDLQTVFYPVSWKDALEIIESSELKMEIEGLKVPGKLEENLCIKAYHLIRKNFDIPSVHIFLLKNIPMGAGLGGGSADGAFMLKLLNEKFNLNLTEGALEKYAAELGSDCPFFIKNKPVYAFGRGEQFEQINVDLSGKYIFLVYPNIEINTGWAFSQLNPNDPEEQVYQTVQRRQEQWQEKLINDFEKPVFNKYPELAKIKNKIAENGAVYSAMSGSGSSIFGIFQNEDNFERMKSEFQEYRTFSSSL